MIKYDDMALFVEVVKARGFRSAGERLGVACSTMSRRVVELERAVGLRLLKRSTRHLELTEAGQLYYERCERIVEEAKLAHVQLEDMLVNPSGLLRVSLPADFAVVYLTPLLADFSKCYPEIAFELDLTARPADLMSEHVDVAISVGEQLDSGLIAQHLVSIPRLLYASPSYLEQCGSPNHPRELAQHSCIRMNAPEDRKGWTLARGRNVEKVETGRRYSVNSAWMQLSLTTAGQGIALLSSEVAREDVSSGRLVEVLPGWSTNPIPVYAITETRLLPAKAARFVEYLRNELRRNVATPTKSMNPMRGAVNGGRAAAGSSAVDVAAVRRSRRGAGNGFDGEGAISEGIE